MKNLFAPVFISAIVFASCGSDSSSTVNESDTTRVNPAPDTATYMPPVTKLDTNRTSVIPQPINPVVLPKAATPTANSTAKGLNPEHGMPGHRCDIAVGAPLNGQPVAANPTINPTINPIGNTAPAKTSGTVRLNPAHGMPGHDCAVEVGKPLNN
ncbi:MAG: hypothetical protein H0U44_08970 [Flavisolibacter sp.]|nr:hypothetical protein [Flavisolibacter sp.]